MKNELELGKSIQNARKAAGMTQQELCQAVTMSYSTLAKIERGAIRSPSVFTVAHIAQVTNTSVEELLGMEQSSLGAHGLLPAKSKSGISFVYVDINGVLVRFFHRAFALLAERSSTPSDKLETTFWHYNDAVCRGELSLDEFNGILADQLGVTSVDWRKCYLESVDPIVEMQECVRSIASRYRVGLLSNIFPGFIEQMIALQILPNVPYASVIDSSEVGAIKPEAKIYEVAQAIAGVPANEILLVDDSRTNLMAAEHMGWHVLWFDDFRPAESVERIIEALA